MLQMYTALGSMTGLAAKLTLTLLAIYVPGGPFMILSMFKQRAGAAKKRKETVCACPLRAVSAGARGGVGCRGRAARRAVRQSRVVRPARGGKG
jgi:hypothetical protein